MALASVFLLPNGTFFVELVVFLIIVFVIGKYALPPLNRVIAQRQEQIRTSLEAADQARADAAAADDERRHVLEEARQQAREIVALANQTADQVRTDAVERAQAEFDRIVATAQAEIAAARQRAVEESAGRMGELVLEVVEKIISREVDLAAHRDLIDQAVEALREDARSPSARGAAAGAHQ
jgi:F-type H+-transporting ATPase subunit b